MYFSVRLTIRKYCLQKTPRLCIKKLFRYYAIRIVLPIKRIRLLWRATAELGIICMTARGALL